MSEQDISSLLSALLLAADKPLHASAVADLVNAAADEEEWPAQTSTAEINEEFEALKERYAAATGIELIQVAGGWRLRTAAELSGMVRRLWPDRKVRLSRASLEVLAVVAYRQPCTRHEVEGVRGVDCGGVLRSLMERKLVRIVGRMDEPGRPLLYGTTPLFLETFSLNTLKTLPTLRDLESLEAEEDIRAMLVEQGLDGLDPENLEADDEQDGEDAQIDVTEDHAEASNEDVSAEGPSAEPGEDGPTESVAEPVEETEESEVEEPDEEQD